MKSAVRRHLKWWGWGFLEGHMWQETERSFFHSRRTLCYRGHFWSGPPRAAQSPDSSPSARARTRLQPGTQAPRACPSPSGCPGFCQLMAEDRALKGERDWIMCCFFFIFYFILFRFIWQSSLIKTCVTKQDVEVREILLELERKVFFFNSFFYYIYFWLAFSVDN